MSKKMSKKIILAGCRADREIGKNRENPGIFFLTGKNREIPENFI